MPERARAAHYWIDEFGSRIPGATVEIRNAANTAPITDTIYAFDDPDASVLPNPFTSDAAGKAEAYLANAKRVIFRFSKTGYTTQDIPKDFTFPANRFLYRNLWVNTTTYAANDVVRYNGESWVALRASTGVTPVEGADWSLMAAKGATQDLSAYQALSDLVVAKVYRSTNQSITASTVTAVSFSTEAVDASDMWVAGSPTRLTVPTGKGGRWLVGASVIWQAGTGGTRRYLRIRKNGTTTVIADDRSQPGNATIQPTNLVVGEINLAAGDYVETEVFHDSGAALALVTEGEQGIQMWARRAGP